MSAAIGTRLPFVGAAVALLLVGACGSSPTVPSASASALPLIAGTYLMEISGADLVFIGSGPVLPGCPGISDAGLRPVRTEIDVTLESGIWRGRPRAVAAGSFELRFSPGPIGPGGPGDGGTGVVATATGTVINTLALPPTGQVDDSQVMFGSDATLTGGLSRDGRVGSGMVSGNLTFGNSRGALISCNSGTVSWLVSRTRG
jgi:hypothetical protein